MEQSNTTGISLDRLVNPINSSLDHLTKCKICFNILVDPHDCDKCGNTFCFNCINNLLLTQRPCPFNCENYSIKPSSLVIKTCLMNLKFICLNKVNGCNKQLDYMEVSSHDKECPYSNAICPNVKCQKQIKRQLLEYHIKKECEYSLFKCDNCELKFTRANYVEHVKNCKVISDIFDLKNPIIDDCSSFDEMKGFELNVNDQNLKNFLKIFLFQMAKTNLETNRKLDILCEEIINIKEDISKNSSANNLILENITNEIEVLNEKVSNVESGLTSTENMKKIVEDNLRETVLLKENIGMHQSTNSGITKSNNSSNNNSIIIHNNTTKPPSTNSSINTNPIPSNQTTNKTKQPNDTNVKKITLRSTYKNTDTRSPQNRSPVNNRSPNSKNFNTNYNTETESFGYKTNNITLIKTMLKNQDSILERLSKITSKIEIVESKLGSENKKSEDNIKVFLKEEVLDELKALILETSLDNTNFIVKKLDEMRGN